MKTVFTTFHTFHTTFHGIFEYNISQKFILDIVTNILSRVFFFFFFLNLDKKSAQTIMFFHLFLAILSFPFQGTEGIQ